MRTEDVQIERNSRKLSGCLRLGWSIWRELFWGEESLNTKTNRMITKLLAIANYQVWTAWKKTHYLAVDYRFGKLKGSISVLREKIHPFDSKESRFHSMEKLNSSNFLVFFSVHKNFNARTVIKNIFFSNTFNRRRNFSIKTLMEQL